MCDSLLYFCIGLFLSRREGPATAVVDGKIGLGVVVGEYG